MDEISKKLVKEAIKEEIFALDNLYIQIKLHHERRDFEKAIQLFKEVTKRNERIMELKEMAQLQMTV